MPKGSTSKKVVASSSHPKYEEMIKDAILALKDRKGSSRQAIKKWILSNHKLPDNPTTTSRIRLAINKGVDKSLFAFNNGPSGTIKLVKREPKKEKKEVEKKDKIKKEKKDVVVKPKTEKKKTSVKKITKKVTKVAKKAAPAKKATPKKSTARITVNSAKKATPRKASIRTRKAISTTT